MATAAPPLGPNLGKRGINVANFCKDFNRATSNIKPGTPLPTRVTIKPDRTYDTEICTPTSMWLLMRAAGIRRGATHPCEEISGMITVKHIYEIAKIKAADKCLVGVPLKLICEQLIKTAHTIGLKVVRKDLDPVEYRKFLEERKLVVDKELKTIEEDKAAKVLRTTPSSSTL
ncbi:ribosomal protein L11 domain-containing protein [Loa loa]|nr:ribosomal protein L11 domain-containing protein [Loa loa]EFO22846.2 ribosomal protein L11 domain-containing protein [Loa loa]